MYLTIAVLLLLADFDNVSSKGEEGACPVGVEAAEEADQVVVEAGQVVVEADQVAEVAPLRPAQVVVVVQDRPSSVPEELRVVPVPLV